MQQVYESSDEHVEVFTTIFSPQACRRSRRQAGPQKVVAVVQHRSHRSKELDLNPGDQIQVLFKENEARWFGRLPDGTGGYFPAACVEALQAADPPGAAPALARRGSVPVGMVTASASCGRASGHDAPEPPRSSGARRSLDPVGASVPAPGGGKPRGAPGLLHRVLAKSRRKSCPHLPHLPHLPHPPAERGAVNATFLPDDGEPH